MAVDVSHIKCNLVIEIIGYLPTDSWYPKEKANPSAISRERNSWLWLAIWVSELQGKNWEMAQWTQKLMNENKHKEKKANQWICKYY